MIFFSKPRGTDDVAVVRAVLMVVLWMFLHRRPAWNLCVTAASHWSWLDASCCISSVVFSARGFLLASAQISLWLRFVSSHLSSSFCSFPILPSLLFFLCISLLPLIDPPPPPPPVHAQPPQTYPITRTITIKARLWIKEMISPQWPMPWRGWVPLRLSRPCPAEPDPSPACTTASCSARAARRPSRGSRWTRHHIHHSGNVVQTTQWTVLQVVVRSYADKASASSLCS